MKLTVQIKLLPNREQADKLLATLKLANQAANRLAQLTWEKTEFRRFPMGKAFYHQLRTEFPLTSMMVCLLIAKVANAYKTGRQVKRTFKQLGSISYNLKTLDFNLHASTVSIWAIGGRIKKLPFVCSEQQRKLLELPRGESNLVLHRNTWLLNVTIEVPEALENRAVDWLGIDVGLVNLAQSSDGQTFGDARKVAGIRARRWRQRKRLQRKGTRSAKRVLRRLSGREKRFIAHENHAISKQIVGVAERTKRGIALEDLKGIRSRIRANRKQRCILHSWAFHDLQQKVTYKSRLLGVPVMFVDPRNTSRTCPACGCIDKKNRSTRDTFTCIVCGFTDNADTNGAVNLRQRARSAAAVDQPHEQTKVYAQ